MLEATAFERQLMMESFALRAKLRREREFANNMRISRQFAPAPGKVFALKRGRDREIIYLIAFDAKGNRNYRSYEISCSSLSQKPISKLFLQEVERAVSGIKTYLASFRSAYNSGLFHGVSMKRRRRY